MKYTKCLLVRLAYGHWMHAVATMPVGLGYVAEALLREGVDVRVFDMAFRDQGLKGYEVTDLMRAIEAYQPDVVGFSLMTLNHNAHYRVIEQIKHAFPDITVVAGGPHLSTVRETVLKECPAVDYGFVLEGDLSFPEFCKGTPIDEIKGVLYRVDGDVRYTGDARFIRDLDALPFPRYQKFELHKYPDKTMYITTSRGCPHQCTYCPVKVSIGRQFRYVSARSLVDEILYWYGEGYRNFVMWDDNFTLIKERVMEFCDLINRERLSDSHFSIPNGIRADMVDREMLLEMKKTGFSQLSIGVESGSNKVLKNLKKGETVEQIDRAIHDATDLEYKVYLYFILGSPGETLEDVQKSFDLALKYPVAEARFYKLIPFPGTELFEWVRERNLFVRPPEEYLNDADHFNEMPCFVTDELGYNDRIAVYRRGQAVSKAIRIQYRKRQFAKAGILGAVLAHTAENETLRKHLKRIPLMEKVIYKAVDIFRKR